MPHRRTTPPLSFARAAFLAALLLLAQGLGLVHGVSHGLAQAAPARSNCDDGHTHEAGDAECRLVDAHGLADAAAEPAALRVLPAAAGVAPRAMRPASPRASPAVCPPARGPPLRAN